MEHLELIVPLEDLKVTGTGHNIDGTIYFRPGDKTFPGAGWFDFPITILGWWIDNLSSVDDFPIAIQIIAHAKAKNWQHYDIDRLTELVVS